MEEICLANDGHAFLIAENNHLASILDGVKSSSLQFTAKAMPSNKSLDIATLAAHDATPDRGLRLEELQKPFVGLKKRRKIGHGLTMPKQS
ncbi:MAG: hypothetical protein GJ676_02580 [Rhodobacteraceae bacterium]|nr:hypothetical protein [Paracoccaceae bacterium]